MKISRIVMGVMCPIVFAVGCVGVFGNPPDKKKKKEKPLPVQFPVARPNPYQSAQTASAPPAPKANGSLFSSGSPGTDLFSDFKPRRVGDLVFVNIVEVNTAVVAAN